MANEKYTFTIEINGVKESHTSIVILKDIILNLTVVTHKAASATEKLTESSKKQTEAVKNAAGSINELKEELKTSKEQYDALSEAERTNSEIGGVLADKIRNLKVELSEAQSQTHGLFESFERLNTGFSNATEIVGGLVSIYQAGSDVVGLFGGNTEKLEKIIKDLNKVTAVLNSLQKVNNLVLKEGSVVQKLFQGTVGGSTVAVKGFSKALIATGVGALIAALGFLIANFEDIKKKVLEVCPQLEGLGEVFNTIQDYVIGFGKAVLDYFLTPFRTAIAVVSKLIEGDFKGAIDAGINEVKKGVNIVGNVMEEADKQREKREAEAQKKRLEENIKEHEQSIKLIEAGKDANWKYSLEGQVAYTALFLKKMALYAADKEKMHELLVEQTAYFKQLSDFNEAKNEKILADNKRAAEQAKQQRDKILKDIEQFFKDTEALSEENLNTRLEKEKAAADTVEKLDAYYAKEEELIKKRSEAALQAVKEEYDTLSAKVKEGTQEWTQLNESYNQRILQLKEKTTNQEVALEEEKYKAIKAIQEKQKEDEKKSLEQQATEIEEIKSKIPKDIEYRGDDGEGIINVEATKKNIDEANRCLDEYIKKMEVHRDKIEKFYKGQMSLYSKDSDEYKKLQKEKEKALLEANAKINAADKQMKENQKLSTDLQSAYWNELLENIQEQTGKIMEHVNQIAEKLTSFLQSQMDDAKERLEEITAKYDEVAEKKEESDDRISELEDKARDARGGALLVYQQQINEEMAKNKQLANQEKDLAKQKEKQEKEIAKKERQMKKVQLSQEIAQAIANTAMAVTSALTVKPFPVGLVLAGIAGAKGAIEVATMTKQLSKLEDGGLLNGKRHSDGGMRIEGTNIEVEGGEYVINRRTTRENFGLVDYINSQRRKLSPADLDAYFQSGGQAGVLASTRSLFEAGGQLPVNVTDNNIALNNDQLVEAIRSIQIKPVVSVEDINHAQQNTVEVNSWIGM